MVPIFGKPLDKQIMNGVIAYASTSIQDKRLFIDNYHLKSLDTVSLPLMQRLTIIPSTRSFQTLTSNLPPSWIAVIERNNAISLLANDQLIPPGRHLPPLSFKEFKVSWTSATAF